MTIWTNTAEGGISGGPVTTTNSGGLSGTAFNSIVTSGGVGTVEYDNSQAAHGTVSIKCTGNTRAAGVQWGFFSAASFAARVYIRFSVLPTALCSLINFPTAVFIFNSTGRFAFVDSAAIYTPFSSPVSTGVWYRLEMEAQAGTTSANGYLAGRYFLGDATTPVETQYSSSVRDVGTGSPFTSVSFGVVNNTSAVCWIDDLALTSGTITPIGPAAAAVPAFAGWGIPL